MKLPMPILRGLQRAGRTRAVAAVSPRVIPALDRLVHRLSGRRTRLTDLLFPTLVLEHTGRRSGRSRETALAYARDGAAFVLADTNFGRAHRPGWSHNLLAASEAAVVLAGERIPVKAELAAPADRERVWPDLVRIWPGFADYRGRTGREVRVFLLRPQPRARQD